MGSARWLAGAIAAIAMLCVPASAAAIKYPGRLRRAVHAGRRPEHLGADAGAAGGFLAQSIPTYPRVEIGRGSLLRTAEL